MRFSRVILLVVAGLIIFFAAAKLRYPGKASMRLPAEECDMGLWNHVYERDRLQVIEPCVAVNGQVRSIHNAEDGDFHIALDPEDKSVLSLLNAVHTHCTLVVEIICDHVATGADAKASCGEYHSHLAVPRVGDRLRVIGAYVTDRDNGWREIHPVSRIERLP